MDKIDARRPGVKESGVNTSSGVLLEGCSVCAYDAGDETKIEAARQRDGSTKWAVRRQGEVLGRDGVWEWEPMPSGRDGGFLGRCRFDTPQEAWECLQQARMNA